MWNISEFATKHQFSCLIDVYNDLFTSLHGFPMNPDVVWVRRISKPIVPNCLHEDDRLIAKRDSYVFLKSIFALLSRNSFLINPTESSEKANNKILQLIIAKEIGFNVPKTLFSNSKKDIALFIQKNKNTIYKSLKPTFWKDQVSYTSRVTTDDLTNELLTNTSPGIYQEEINKKNDLRITLFGSEIIAVKISKKDMYTNELDWRTFKKEDLKVEQVKIIPSLKEKILQFSKKFNISFGSFDFIIDKNDEYFFLELNEQGQFLWPEINNPDILMLDTFTEFIKYGANDFKLTTKKREIISLHDIFNNDDFEKAYHNEAFQADEILL